MPDAPTTAPRARRAAVALAVAGVIFAVGAVSAVSAGSQGPAGLIGAAVVDLQRADALPDPTTTGKAAPQPPSIADSSTFLLVGADGRGDAETTEGAWQPGRQRSDVTMLVRLLPDGSALLASVPRDSWVDVPGHGTTKVNAAYSYGGPALLVRTLEQETGVEVDHFAAVDFDGLVALTDAVGGVELDVARPTSYQGHDFVEGVNHLDGEAALAFVRQRKNLPRGDLDRVENQQLFLRALADQVVSQKTAEDPRRLAAVLHAVRGNVTVDERTSLAQLQQVARALGSPSSEGVVSATVPVAGTGSVSGQSVVHLDDEAGAPFWAAFREGDVDAFRELAGGAGA